MRIVESSELSNYKVLPFDLYSENRTKVLEAGEVLTPGKLIMLKNYTKIYTEDFRVSFSEEDNQDEIGNVDSLGDKKTTKLMNFSFESLDPADFETVINRDSWLDIETQVKTKYFYKKILDLFKKGFFEEGFAKLQSLINVLKNEIYKKGNRSSRGSRIRFMGEYELCHPLNVATIAGLMAKKLEYAPRNVDELLLAALLHDIGKLKIELPGESSLISMNEEDLKPHTIIGYKFLREYGMSESIAKVALEHHENNDGSGYPKGISNDFIHPYSQIVNVANYYDNLAFNRTHILVTNNKEALHTMLEVGTKRFSAEMLYTFIHMFNYDDQTDFNDLIV